jgi:nucleoid-associated protein YgaU
MLGDRYIVVQGDNLWRIAAKTLGGGKQWPRIWRYNNRRAVVRVTSRAVPNPDLIHVGQVLLRRGCRTSPMSCVGDS